MKSSGLGEGDGEESEVGVGSGGQTVQRHVTRVRRLDPLRQRQQRPRDHSALTDHHHSSTATPSWPRDGVVFCSDENEALSAAD